MLFHKPVGSRRGRRRRRRGRESLHMYCLYNYYIILTWAVSCIFIIGGLCQQAPPTVQQQQQQQQEDKNRRGLIDGALKSNLLRILNLKEVPKPPTTKAFVPVEMLKEYMKYRDLVRDYIPDDRDFLGKINLEDLHPSDHNFWNDVANKYTNGIEIDMRPSGLADSSADKIPHHFLAIGDITQISAIHPGSDPEDVDPKLEPILPPHFRQKHVASVLMKFNLSQDLMENPYGANSVRGAVLKLNREKLLECREGKCDRRQWITTADSISTNETNENINIDTVTSGPLVPFYQRVYINLITGYDLDGVPMTHVIHNQRVDTRYSTPISYDISGVVKEWLRDPSKNYGIIVRIVNDDPEYDKLVKAETSLQRRTNASTTTTSAQDVLLDHVRLKRGFRSMSDNEDNWLRQKPLLTVYVGSDEDARHNVKRSDEDQPDADMNGAQADAPDSNQPTSSSNSQPANGGSNKPIITKSLSSQRVSQSTTRRGESRRDNAKSGRNSSGGRSSSATASTQRPRGNKLLKNEKCRLVPLSINFDEVGWSNWIIAPSSYFANYCMGDCSFPLADHQNSTNHAIIQAIFHSVGRNIPRTCCAPTKLGRMAILFQLDHSVQMKYYDDMIVESCGCS